MPSPVVTVVTVVTVQPEAHTTKARPSKGPGLVVRT